ncbi:MAG TPA: hypothetical protein VMB26_03535, partial [Candidatus Binataceae bacterium]|nr:hypothetical protein [Candidatus Binataceae bacterium]
MASFLPAWAGPIRKLTTNRHETLWVTLGSLAFALLFSWPLLRHLGQFGAFHDWEFTTELHWVPYYTVWHYHQFPLWNPYKCGGMPMFGNPQSRILTPFFLLHLITGPVLGLQLEIILHLAIAWAGGYVLGRCMGFGPLASVVCASVFPASSWYYLHIGEGHTVFLPAAYLPWIAALFYISVERRKLLPAALSGLLVALVFFEGGLYLAIFVCILIACLALPMLLTRLSLWPLWSGAAIAIFTVGFSAVKLLPSVDVFRMYPRAPMGGESNPWWVLKICLFSHYQSILRNGPGSFGFQEYGAFISLFFVALAILGAVYGWRRPLPWLIAAAIFLELARGDTGPHSLWVLIRSVPLFAGLVTAMRLPTRILIPFVLTVSVLAGSGAEMLCAKLRRVGPWLAGVLLLAGLVDVWIVGPPNLGLIFRDSTPTLTRSMQFRQMRQLGAKFNMTHVAQANMGALECYEYTDIDTNAVGYDETGYKGEQYLTGPGMVDLTRWTPNALSFDVTVFSPSELIVNQNYEAGWHLAQGLGKVSSDRGLIAIHLPAGRQHL